MIVMSVVIVVSVLFVMMLKSMSVLFVVIY